MIVNKYFENFEMGKLSGKNIAIFTKNFVFQR